MLGRSEFKLLDAETSLLKRPAYRVRSEMTQMPGNVEVLPMLPVEAELPARQVWHTDDQMPAGFEQSGTLRQGVPGIG